MLPFSYLGFFFFIFRSQLFQLQLSSFMSLEMISILSSPVIFKQNFKTYRLRCEVGWCHFHFFDFFFFIFSIDFPVILKNAPIGFIVKWVGAIFISWIFFFIFPVIFLSFENCPNMLHCEVRWCHFCFLEFCCFGVYHFHFFSFCS